MTLLRVSGSHLIHSGYGLTHLFALPLTRRIIQFNGLDFSTGSSISPLQARASLPNPALFFIRFRELNEACPRELKDSIHRHALKQLLVPIQDNVDFSRGVSAEIGSMLNPLIERAAMRLDATSSRIDPSASQWYKMWEFSLPSTEQTMNPKALEAVRVDFTPIHASRVGGLGALLTLCQGSLAKPEHGTLPRSGRIGVGDIGV